ncbi:BrnT family toxin [Candidatus Thiosymbion oneisti]|uniref:BrnT family toxin n=1 Tax=Candidatus Thiosymbion oneisti TaxID=589554 RepID=UPI000B7F614C|nr:BrnT family toxin [Candidatus Thiosymbion oneisti]
MKIEGFIWYRSIIDKLLWKHDVTHEEVEELFNNSPKFKLVEKGKVKNENLYSARGQTNAGRYLAALFIYKKTKEALIVTARDMDPRERKNHGKK